MDPENSKDIRFRTRTMHLVVGKLNVNPNLFSYGQADTISRVLRELFEQQIRDATESVWGGRQSRWVITDNTVLDVEGTAVAAGRLGKVREMPTQTFDWDSFQQRKRVVPDAYEFANFVLDLETELTAFEEKQTISARAFMRAFAEICMQANPALGYVSIYPRIDAEEFFVAIRQLKTVHEFVLDFVRPNPVNMEDPCNEFRERLLEEPRSDRATVKLESQRGSLNLESGVIVAGQHMVDKGYGDVTLKGTTDAGIAVEIRSGDKLLRRSVQATDEVSSFVPEFMRVIIEVRRPR
ncbi:MAG: hypothetical protein ACM309_00265 [Bacillota bacterium]